MTQVNPTIAYYAYLNSSWVALDWHAGIIDVSQGMMDNSETTHLASVGRLSLSLLNNSNKYTPGHASALSGWKNGVKIKQVITYDSVDYPSLWHIDPKNGIKIDANDKGERRANITAYDWLDYAVRFPVVNPTLLTDKTGAEVVTELLSDMATPPENTSFDTGLNIFTTALDVVTDKTRVYDELAKLALSEWGYIYVRPDTTDGETLYFDNFLARNGLNVETVFDTTKTFDGDNTYVEADITSGNNIINSATMYAYPRRLDASAVVLFTLSEPFMLASGKSVKLKGTYVNPTGGNRANGYSMVTPVATTDYLMNTLKDGTGTNKTSDLSIVESVIGTSGFEHTLTNAAAQNCWITKYNYRGKGIYIENPIQYTIENAASATEVGVAEERIYQKYQKNLDFGTMLSNSIVAIQKDGENRINSFTFYANTSDEMMKAFLQLGIGDVVRLKSDRGAIDAYHYIQGVKYKILPGRIILCTWIVKEFKNLALGLSLVGTIFNASGTTDAVDFGTLPFLSNQSLISCSAWIYTHDLASNNQAIVTFFSDAAGFNYYVGTDGRIYLTYIFSNGTNSYRTTDVVITENTWHHVEFTRDLSSSTNAPHIWVDGTDEALQKLAGTDGGALVSETGNQLMIGNAKTATLNYSYPFYGWIKGVRIYNVIQDATAIAALYAAGADDTSTETTGLIFQPFCIKTNDVADIDGAQPFDVNYKMIDNIYKVVGTANGTPVPYVAISDPVYTKSLLHFNGADGATTFTDETGKTWTRYGDAQIDTAQYKFGGASGLFDGTGDYIDTPDHADFNFGAGDFTIDFWMRSTSIATTQRIFGQCDASITNTTRSIDIDISSSKFNTVMHQGTTLKYVQGVATLQSDTWYHIALVRYGNTFTQYINGTADKTVDLTGFTLNDSGNVFSIGRTGLYAADYFTGWLDEFRVSKGVARWTANFTPPAYEYAI